MRAGPGGGLGRVPPAPPTFCLPACLAYHWAESEPGPAGRASWGSELCGHMHVSGCVRPHVDWLPRPLWLLGLPSCPSKGPFPGIGQVGPSWAGHMGRSLPAPPSLLGAPSTPELLVLSLQQIDTVGYGLTAAPLALCPMMHGGHPPP